MTEIEVGGIYRAVAMDRNTPSALVLVTDVDPSTQSVTATLLSPDLEFGTSTDLVLTGDEIGRAYDLLAESDIFGYAWFVQLDRRIGRVDADLLQALSALRDEDAVDRPVAGPPVIERTDPRWSFKVQELKRLQTLTADCTRDLIDGDRVPEVDANALRVPATEAEKEAFEEFVVEAVEEAKRGAARIPGWLVEIAIDEELRDAYRAAGLFNALRLLMKYADTACVPNTAPTGTTLGAYAELQVEYAASAGYSNIWLLGRSTDIRGPIEARPVRTRTGRLIQVTHVSAIAHVTQYREVYA